MPFASRSNSSLLYAAHPLHCFPVRLDQGSDVRWMGQWRPRRQQVLLQVRAFSYCSEHVPHYWNQSCMASKFNLPIGSYTVVQARSHVLTCSQGVTKRCCLYWLANSALQYKPKRGGGGGVAGSQPMRGAQINIGDLNPYLTYACSNWFPLWTNERRGAVTWPYLQDPASAWQAPAAVRPPQRRRPRPRPRPDRRVRGASPTGDCDGGNRRSRRCPQRDDPAPPAWHKDETVNWSIIQGRRDSWRRRLKNHFGKL